MITAYFASELREEIPDWSMLRGNILPQSWGKKYLISLCYEEIILPQSWGKKYLISLCYEEIILPQSWGKKYFIGLCQVELFYLSVRGSKIWTRGSIVLCYISHEGACRPKGYGFWAFLVWKRVCILPIFVWNRVRFLRELWKRMNVFIVSLPNE